MVVAITADVLVAGLLVGLVYALMCLGLGLIWGVMKVINFSAWRLYHSRWLCSVYDMEKVWSRTILRNTGDCATFLRTWSSNSPCSAPAHD